MGYVVGIDIGGTKMEAVLFDRRFRQHRKKRYLFGRKNDENTIRTNRRQLLALICSAIDDMAKGVRIEGIGVGLPDIVTLDGSIKGPTRLKALSDFPIASYLKRKYRCRVKVANDADCFTLAEQRLGAARGCRNVFGLIYGTGVGGGLVIDGKLYHPGCSAGEIGHNVVDPCGPVERLGIKGTVESFAGGPELVRRYRELGGRIEFADSKSISDSKEKAAKQAIGEALDHIAMGLGGVMNLLNPEIIVVGGGQSNMKIYSALNRLTRKYTHPGLRSNVRIVKNKLGDSAGVYGAAILAFDQNK